MAGACGGVWVGGETLRDTTHASVCVSTHVCVCVYVCVYVFMYMLLIFFHLFYLVLFYSVIADGNGEQDEIELTTDVVLPTEQLAALADA